MSKLTTHQRKARDLIQREDWDGALTELQRILSVDANNPALHNQIGDVYLRKDDVDQACDHFELAVDIWRRVDWGARAGIGEGTKQYYLGRALEGEGREEDAVAAYRKAAASASTAFTDDGLRIALAARDRLADLGVSD